jgi:hypothetical protein
MAVDVGPPEGVRGEGGVELLGASGTENSARRA